jgi:putative membrane protein
MNPHVPPPGGHGPHGWEESSFSLLPLLGTFLLVLVLAALTAVYLYRHGKLTLPRFGGVHSPEDEAKRILAERFARGDINTDDFMERASILNWTPGSAQLPSRPGKKRR